MQLILSVLLLALGFVLLIKGADFFVDGAAKIADKLHIPQLVIGLTIVAFGTSAPEAAISITAGLRGNAGIAVGNVLGSNIFNILLILGVTALLVPLRMQRSTLRIEIPFTFFVTLVLTVLGLSFGVLNLWSGILLWVLFLLFLVYLWRLSKKETTAFDEAHTANNDPLWKLLLWMILGMAAIIWGSDLTVDNATKLAQAAGISDRVIGLTIVAFGTSLPELITSITAAKKGNGDIAIGNIIGSNIFNILFVLGTTSLVATVPYGNAFLTDSLCAIAAVAMLFFCVLRRKRLTRTGGIVMLVSYAAYFTYLCLS